MPRLPSFFRPHLRTPLYRLRTDLKAIAKTLPMVMRRGNLSAAEEMTSHKDAHRFQVLKLEARSRFTMYEDRHAQTFAS